MSSAQAQGVDFFVFGGAFDAVVPRQIVVAAVLIVFVVGFVVLVVIGHQVVQGIVAGSLLVMLPSLGLFYVSDLLGGAKNLLIGNVIKRDRKSVV